MGFFRRTRLFRPRGEDRFAVELAPEARAWLVNMADQLEELLLDDTDDTKRLFPTAYPNDPELDAGYQILARDQLIDSRRASIELLRSSAMLDVVSEEELVAWMGIVNDLRLVLGTRLDVSEDDHDLDVNDPELEARVAYHELGYILSEIVDALTTTLPPVDDADE
ncbi:MAG: DUF2017 domain-containing protein [Acidimicrobiia bacterium]|nr:DUF2017 domain-containing protein [Acidimicrobiia bacterium]